MKRKITIHKTLVATALLIALVLSIAAFTAQTASQAALGVAGQTVTLSGGRYRLSQPGVEGSALQGGHYRLTSLSPVKLPAVSSLKDELASGGGYHLSASSAPHMEGAGCCCVYLPCVQRQ